MNRRTPARIIAPGLSSFAARSLGVGLAMLMTTTFMIQQVYPCGGCFSPPGQQNNQLILQNAERVFFARDPQTKKSIVWVEVRYSGLAKDFGWVLPLPAIPKVSVGTSWVFDQMDQRFAPQFSTTVDPKDENCRSWDNYCYGSTANVGGSQSAFGAGAPASRDSNAEGKSGGDGGVKILESDSAGPYNYQVIAAQDPAVLLKWLNDNGYATPDKALPIISSHLKKGDVFVAVKLQAGTGANMIRPIVLEMDDAEACVPLRLTSIAAADDMSIVTTIAGPGRAIPKNLMHVEINQMKLNWFQGGNNYASVMAEAIDEAAGHAFVTEFSGDAKAGRIAGVQQMTAEPFRTITNAQELSLAIQQSKIPMTTDAANTLELGAGLAKLAGQTPQQYYNLVRSCGFQHKYGNCKKIWADLATLPVDGPTVAKLMDKDYIKPIQKLDTAVGGSAKISRLVMSISPDEMDRDPIFAFNADLPDVANKITAVFRRVCKTGWYPYDAVRLTVPGAGSWIFDGQLPSQFGNNDNVGNNAIDKRFVQAPMASRIQVLDESGPAHEVAASEVELVDGIITNAQVGNPTVPSQYELKKGEKRWSPPKDDEKRTFVKARDDRDCPRYNPIKPWKVSGSQAAASAMPHDAGMDSLGGGCTVGGPGDAAPLSTGMVAVLAFLIIFVRRRLRASA